MRDKPKFELAKLCKHCAEPYGVHSARTHSCPAPYVTVFELAAPEHWQPKLEYTGKSVSYYRVDVDNPTSPDLPAYSAECNDIIEALGMNFAEGNAFKALWRRAAARTLGKAKEGYKDGLYDAEKVVFFGERMVAQEKARQA